MKRRSFAFLVGGILFGVAVASGTTLLRAGNENVITACANKKTGLLRYITKGSCNRKTELLVTWGSTGPTGPQGEPGLAGAQGPQGPTGRDGQSTFVIDATGRTIGPLVSALPSEGGVVGPGAFFLVLVNGLLWNLEVGRVNYASSIGTAGTGFGYLDSACTQPFVTVRSEVNQNQGIAIINEAPFALSGVKTFMSVPLYDKDDFGECRPLSDQRRTDLDQAGFRIADVTRLERVTYTPPLTIIVR